MPCEKLGESWRIYHNTKAGFKTTEADYDTPTWFNWTQANDITVNATKEAIEMLRRGALVKEYGAAHIDFSISTALNYLANAAQTAIEAHFWNADKCDWMHIAVVNGDITTSGTAGWQFPARIITNGRNLPMAGKTEVPIEIKPAYEQSASVYKEFAALVIA